VFTKKQWTILATLLVIAATFRIAVAHSLATDIADDGRVYSLIARNLLEQRVYSQSEESPYEPTLIRVPGYPLFLAGIYSVFGHTNNGAVRIIQALLDTATCGLVALLAWLWQPEAKKKRATVIAALAFAAVNPFTTIYAATILTEVFAVFLSVATCVAATLAFQKTFPRERSEKSNRLNEAIGWWAIAGALAGLAALVRPDSGLVAMAIGLTLAIAAAVRYRSLWRRAAVSLAIFATALVLALAPWTVRNWRVFHLLQPLAPMNAEEPGEFVPRGYQSWLKTWVDDERYVENFWWPLNTEAMDPDDLPSSAFDSPAEKARVAALFDQYNHAGQPLAATAQNATPQPSPSPSATPQTSRQANGNGNANANANSADQGDEEDANDNTDSGENDDNNSQDESPDEPQGPVKMTPEIDAGFAQLAGERIARHPVRYYLWVPAKRASALWFNTHSDYYPFSGTLFPLDDLDYQAHQQIWLPLFALLIGIYTLAGLGGGFALWDTKQFWPRIWLLLIILIVSSRLALFSTIVSAESRYVVMFFPFLAVLGGLFFAWLMKGDGVTAGQQA
jgi:Dolichyl-phosphate-mannose-protein mannosyltransferase